jgi:predicted nucleotidyltransferase
MEWRQDGDVPEHLARLRGLARDAADALSCFDDVVAIAALGSVARGDATTASDVDLLVVLQQTVRGAHLLRRLPPRLRTSELALIIYTVDRLSTEAASGSLFLRHCALEGALLYDPLGIAAMTMREIVRRPPDVAAELRKQLAKLRLYRHPERLNGRCSAALSHLYSIGKAAAIARCVDLGQPIFVKEAALDRLAEARPDLAVSVAVVKRLRPFYDISRASNPSGAPRPPADSRRVTEAVTAIEHLARA